MRKMVLELKLMLMLLLLKMLLMKVVVELCLMLVVVVRRIIWIFLEIEILDLVVVRFLPNKIGSASLRGRATSSLRRLALGCGVLGRHGRVNENGMGRILLTRNCKRKKIIIVT